MKKLLRSVLFYFLIFALGFSLMVPVQAQVLSRQDASEVDNALSNTITQISPIFSAQNITINTVAEAVELNTSVVDAMKNLTSASIIVRYKNTNSGIGSLISIGDSTQISTHFHVYQYGNVIGFEYRNNDNPKYSATGTVYGGERNTVAFKAEEGVGYKLFANGNLTASLSKTGNSYQFLDDLPTLDSGYIGKLKRSNDLNSYPFTGEIELIEVYDTALSDAELLEMTKITPIFSAQNISINTVAEAVQLNTNLVNAMKNLPHASIIVRYVNTNSGIGSLLSISDSTKISTHFHVYQHGNVLGFEYRNNDNPKYSATGTVYGGEHNTVAFKAEQGVGYKLFANGKLSATLSQTGSSYQFLNNLPTLDTGYVGKLKRSNDVNSYPFTGEIELIEVYDKPLTDAELIQSTAGTARVPNHVFYMGDPTNSTYFRIPFLLSTENDTLIAGIDANFGSTGDSAENIDAAIRTKPNASTQSAMEGWDDAFIPEALHMKDYADEIGYKQKSASFIDGAIVQDTMGTGRVIMMIDAFAWNGGVFSYLNINPYGEAKGGTNRAVAYGDGFATIGNKKYLLLSSQNIKGSANGQTNNINNNTNRSLFNYVADIYGDKNAEGHYDVYHLNGTPQPYTNSGTPVDDSNLSLGALSTYSLNDNYELYNSGQPLMVTQKSSNVNHPHTLVPMRIFYEDSVLQMYNTSYIIQLYSDDEGETWHTDKLISGMFKRENSHYYVLGPGQGIQLKQGTHAGRLLMPIYYDGGTGTYTEVIYSDDGGQTWTHGESIPNNNTLHESALVEMPDGSVKIFVRNTRNSGGKIITATSVDGGETWIDVKSALGDNATGVNSQISTIKYSETIRSSIDGQYYPALILVSANERARVNGKMFVGLIKEDGTYSNGAQKYRVDWEYEYNITGTNELFAYSSMTELANGKIGLLYEASETNLWSDGLKAIYYKEFAVNTYTGVITPQP